MKNLLATTALTAVLVLGGAAGVMAQSSSPSQAANQPAVAQVPATSQLQQAEQVLRQAQQQLSGSGQGDQQAMLRQARQAVTQTQQALGQVPSSMQGQDAYKKAQQQLSEAQSAVQGDAPNRQQAATQLKEAADAIALLHGSMGSSGNSAGGGATGAQIAVQQPAPQVTVQQPAPQITVQQPPPQVTVQQTAPQVTVQQAQPQVTVQQQGQPQVTVQRQGEPQVTVQQGQQQPSAATQTNTTNQQAAAATANAGMPLTRVQSLIGTNVVGADGKDAGEVQNLLIDSKGQVRAAIVQWGGFLGLGESSAAVPIDRIQLGAAGSSNDRAKLNMTKEELERLPRYESGNVVSYGRGQGWGDGVRTFR